MRKHKRKLSAAESTLLARSLIKLQAHYPATHSPSGYAMVHITKTKPRVRRTNPHTEYRGADHPD